MKKTGTALLAALVATAVFTGTAYASNVNMKVNGKDLQFNAGKPFIENGTSMMPLRDLLVGLGVPNANITFDGTTKEVKAVTGDIAITIKVGEKALYKNGKLFKEAEVPAKSVDNRVYLPARVVAEALGYAVKYDPVAKAVVIEDGNSSPSTPKTEEPSAPTEQTSAPATPAPVSSTLDIKLDGNLSVTVPNVKADPSKQVYGVIATVDQDQLGIILADGSTKQLVLADDAKLTFQTGKTHTGKEWKQWSTTGAVALFTLGSDKKTIQSATFEYATLTVKVEQVEQEEYPMVENGVERNQLFTIITGTVGSKSLQMTYIGDMPAEAGASIEVTGTLQNFESFHIDSYK